jgi:hypothetical protein
MKRFCSILFAAVAAGVLGIAVFGTTTAYYGGSDGLGCARCHEIRPSVDAWTDSTHRDVACRECHGSSLATDLRMHLENARRVWLHSRGEVPEQIRVRHGEVPDLVARCARCHAQEFADWQSGPHGVTYAELFLDEAHNRRRLLVDDCLRCHGMHFEGGIDRLVAPLDHEGPWRLLEPSLAEQPAIPCLSCHDIHRSGAPLGSRAERGAVLGRDQPVLLASVALYDRRSLDHVPAAQLTLPTMMDGDEQVRTSPDQRQALCYQCHAPRASAQVFSGDDRTPTGVHEGLSCNACHAKHGQQTRASCDACHPRLSNCGLDVETMDTSFRSVDSAHDVHRVACRDCHPGGVPPLSEGSFRALSRAGNRSRTTK